MNTPGIDIRKAAKHLKDDGINTSDRKLRDQLVKMGAIRKSQFGYEVTQPYRCRGLLVTEIRRYAKPGETVKRDYTVVLITGDGLSWLRDQVSNSTH